MFHSRFITIIMYIQVRRFLNLGMNYSDLSAGDFKLNALLLCLIWRTIAFQNILSITKLLQSQKWSSI